MSTSTELSQKQSGIEIHHPPDQPISDEALTQYGKSLQFDDKYLRKANQICQKVCDALKNSEPRPERFSVSESHVCQEGVEDTGVDIVAYMKETEDLNKAQQRFNEIVNQIGGQKSAMDDKGVLHFDLEGVKVNLGLSTSRGHTVGEHRKAVFQQVAKMDKEGKLQKNQIEKVSVDLHDSMSEFMKDQGKDEFDLAAQRLARAWRRTAIAPWFEDFSPLDSMLVMQNALIKERQRGGTPAMTSVMRQFFNDLRDVESMDLNFRNRSLYDWDIVPQWIQQERPLLLDPVNPWRNVFGSVNRKVFSEISNKAQEALRIIDKEMSRMNELFNVPPEAEKRGA
jgi:hypothetical protein